MQQAREKHIAEQNAFKMTFLRDLNLLLTKETSWLEPSGVRRNFSMGGGGGGVGMNFWKILPTFF